MILFSLDLELEQFPRNTKYEQTIIQIGAVKFDSKSGQILDKFCRFIYMDKPISDCIKQLTGITDSDLQGGTDFLTAYRDLLEWTKDCSTHQAVVWGAGDMYSLKKNLKEVAPEEPWSFGHRSIDVKAIYQSYAIANGHSMRGGLKKSMSRLGVVFEGPAHDAVQDALNTAKFFCWFLEHMKTK
jgi:inhibitor of KinA sporulation pathway (predicted exonuclease)